jgi:acyl transferase domain-containing protein/NADPH:quinone reductase-like Zn-dependent oxidoreductase/NAD(P)-dependent dehydrogenase (short-subunit alcohol dehydrogenase family)/SAM-dependent methyltransferase/acyl carrier protein
VNQDGKTKGIMVPNSQAQRSLIESVYREAHLDPRDTCVIEAHGTGTTVGDPLEVAAIQEAFRSPGDTDCPLYIGSIKPNVGHLEAASGIAGLIKGVLMLEHGEIPATIGIESLKPNLRLDQFGMKIPHQLVDWPSHGIRRLSVNSFGYGGTNAHAILEAAPARLHSKLQNNNWRTIAKRTAHESQGSAQKGECVIAQSESKCLQLVVLSAESIDSIARLAKDVEHWTSTQPPSREVFEDLAFTLASRRSPMQYRLAFPAQSLEDVGFQLKNNSKTPDRSPLNPQLVFVFTGQGAQWYAMGRELMNTISPFRTSLQRSDSILNDLGTEWSLMRELSKEESVSRVNESEISQASTCAIQIALVDLLREIGVMPQTVVGHSSGEIAAAYAAGAIDQASALAIAWFRGRCTQGDAVRNGAMLAVGLGDVEVAPYLDVAKSGRAVIACANSPNSSTVSGDADAIADIETALKADGVFARRLVVERAYHSHHMQEVAEQYHRDIQGLVLGAPHKGTRFISSVSGEEITTAFAPQYWIDNLISKVRFADATRQALRENASHHLFVEIGPHNALAGPIRQTLAHTATKEKISQHSTLMRGQDSRQTFMSLAAELFVQGCSLNPDALNTILRPHRQPSVLSSLSPYPWNHSIKYWHESRLSKEHRFRRHPYHDLLGVQVPGQSPSRPLWRHILSLKRLPWLREHVVNNEIIFPASAYITMVLEAMRQVANDPPQLEMTTKYGLRDVFFLTPFLIPVSGSPVELQLQFVTVEGSQWKDFHICGIDSQGTITEHCRGSALAMPELGTDEVEGSRESNLIQASAIEHFKCVQSLPNRDNIDTTAFYQDLRSRGNVYGPHFACMKELSVSAEHALGRFQIPNIAECMPAATIRPHLIHPAVLDAFLHPSVALADPRLASHSVVIASIRNFEISSSAQSAQGAVFSSCTQATDHWSQACTTDVHVFQFDAGKNQEPVVQIQGLRIQALGISDISLPRDASYLLKWGVDADYVTHEDINPYLTETDEVAVIQAHKLHVLNQASALYIDQCLKDLEQIEGVSIQGHFQRLLKWMQRFRTSQEYIDLVSTMQLDHTAKTVFDESRTMGVEGEVLVRIGENMMAILNGKIDPLSLFVERDLLWRLYADDASVRCYGFAIEYLRHLTFKNPNMKVLEIGAGTGGATEPILEALSSDSTFPFQAYDFTDVSTAFFERSKIRLRKWHEIITYRRLDLQEDALRQGFQEESYDLVLASNVLHVAHSIDAALSRIQRLLKPGGRILMIETTRTVPFLNTAIGVLPGWWDANDGRIDGPLLSEAQWDSALLRNGLGGVSVVAKDFDGPGHRCSMLVSKPCSLRQTPDQMTDVPLEILMPPVWERKMPTVAKKLVSSLKSRGCTVAVVPLKTVSPSPDKYYILLDNGKEPVLRCKDPLLFKSVTQLVSRPISLLWLSIQEDASSANNPEKGLITGFARVARVENRSLRVVTLDIQDAIASEHSQNAIVEVVRTFLKTMRIPHQVQSTIELDCIFRNGQLHIPRVVPDPHLNHSISKSLGTAVVKRQPFHQDGRPLRLSLNTSRIIDRAEFIEDGLLESELPSDHLEVLVQAFGVNFKDVLIAGGHTKSKLDMAGEFAGTVVAVGASCRGSFEPGDRICGFGATPYASQVRVRAETVAKLPTSISTTVGASIPVTFATAYHALVNIATLKKGKTVLIHSATGGVGQAAISIAQWIGAEVVATVGNASKKSFLMKEFRIPETHIFSSKLRTFKHGIDRLTKGQGVDAVLNSLSGQMLQDSLSCVARFGTFVEIGKADIHLGSRIAMTPFDANITMASVDLSMLHRYRPEETGQLIQKVVSLISDGWLRIPTLTVHPLEELSAVFGNLRRRTHVGKIVLDAGEAAMVEAPARQDKISIPSDATFVVAGGRSGIGLEIAKYLASIGVGHMVLLSRRNVDSTEEDRVSDAFRNTKAQVKILSCDITDTQAIETKLVRALRGMPPVCGVVQSSMLLQGRMISDMKVEDFAACTAPKIEGTQNLIEALKGHPLQFFILLSSVVGGTLGILAEANYAAANAYLNSLAMSKRDSQPRFIAVCPGIVEDVGALANDRDKKALLQRQGFLSMKAREVVALVNYALSEEVLRSKCSEITAGFDYQSFLQSERLDALENPLFSHLPRTTDRNLDNGANQTAEAVDISIANASTREKAEAVIIRALANKIRTLIAHSEEDLDVNQRVADLGIDSLVLVELRNWIAQTFKATLQNSEILKAPSVTNLAALLAVRSSLVRSKPSSNSVSKQESESQYM